MAVQEERGGAVAWWKRSPEAWGPGQRLLACGAQVIAELRAAVLVELGYSCSAGEAIVASRYIKRLIWLPEKRQGD